MILGWWVCNRTLTLREGIWGTFKIQFRNLSTSERGGREKERQKERKREREKERKREREKERKREREKERKKIRQSLCFLQVRKECQSGFKFEFL